MQCYVLIEYYLWGLSGRFLNFVNSKPGSSTNKCVICCDVAAALGSSLLKTWCNIMFSHFIALSISVTYVLQFSLNLKWECFFMSNKFNVKFCVKIGKILYKHMKCLQTAYGDADLRWLQTCQWWKRFKNDWSSTDGDPPHSGQKLMKLLQYLREIIHSYCHLTVRKVAEEISIAKIVLSWNYYAKFNHELHCSQICTSPFIDEQK